MDVNLATYSALVALELAATDSSSMRRSRSSAGFEPMGVKTSRLSGCCGVDVSTCDANLFNRGLTLFARKIPAPA
jgi:hypothetical protein